MTVLVLVYPFFLPRVSLPPLLFHHFTISPRVEHEHQLLFVIASLFVLLCTFHLFLNPSPLTFISYIIRIASVRPLFGLPVFEPKY